MWLLNQFQECNRVDNWGTQWPHQWHTWRQMLPQYLRELT